MSQRGKKRARDGDEPELSQNSGRAPGIAVLDKKDVDNIVGEVMRFMLFQQTKKIPVKMSEIRKVINKRCIHTDIMTEVKNRFNSIFGYKVEELPLKYAQGKKANAVKPPGAKKKVEKIATSETYILTLSASPPASAADGPVTVDVRRHIDNCTSDKEKRTRGFLVTVLGLVQLNHGNIEEVQLWRLLKDLGVSPKDDNLGGAKELLNTFIKQMYLEKIKVEGQAGEETHYQFVVGPRARMELPAKESFEFISLDLMEENEVQKEALQLFIKQAEGTR